MAAETFTPQSGILPDYSLAENWSGGAVPGPGTTAIIDDATALVDPEVSISAHILLDGTAALSGNGGGFSLGPGSAVSVAGAGALYADGAIVNQGAIAVTAGDTLLIVVEDGTAIAQTYGLNVPSFENAGRITVDGGTLDIAGAEFSNTGDIRVAGGTLAVTGGWVDGGQSGLPQGGQVTITKSGFAYFEDGVSNQTITFAGAGTLEFADAADISSVTIAGFSNRAEILAPSVQAAEALLKNLDFAGLPLRTAPAIFATAEGAEILLEPAPPCFARGTNLLTPGGYKPVEALAPGDAIVTASGNVRAVIWTGSRTIDIAAHHRPDAVRPIRIMPGAIAPGIPAAAVRLSPDHALLLQGQLVPVKRLVNGATILRETLCPAITYLHVELDRHEILVAENLAVESYLDTGNRHMFETSSGSPVFGRGNNSDARAFAPLCLAGPMLRDIRQDIRNRALEVGYRTRTLTQVLLWVAGQKYLPVAGTAAQPIFHLPCPHPATAALRSARFVPAEMDVGANDDDYRSLGIALASIQLGRKNFSPAEVSISGFYPRAAGDRADWTNGHAIIAIPPDIATIRLNIAALPQGWVSPAGHAVVAL